MQELGIFAAVGALVGVISVLAYGRRFMALAPLAGLYAAALAVCAVIGAAHDVAVLSFIFPFVATAALASMLAAAVTIATSRRAVEDLLARLQQHTQTA